MDMSRFASLYRETECMDSDNLMREMEMRITRLPCAATLQEVRLLAQDLDLLLVRFRFATQTTQNPIKEGLETDAK